MSYSFRTVAVQESAPGFDTIEVRSNIFNLQSLPDDFQEGDVMHLRYRDGNKIKGVYGVATDRFGNYFKFDQRIYKLFTDILPQDVLGGTIYRADVYSKVSSYDIQTSVNRAVYGNDLKAYNITTDYFIAINKENRKFFGEFEDVVSANKIIFVDNCDLFAYGVSLSEESYANINNTFSQKTTFKIAQR